MSNMNKTTMCAMQRGFEAYAREVVERVASVEGFDAATALEKAGFPKVEVQCVRNVPKPKSVVLPWSGMVDKEACQGIRVNHGLYTQCKGGKEGSGEYCATCSRNGGPKYGDISERGSDEFAHASKVLRYSKVMDKLNISREEAEAAAKEVGATIPESEFEKVAGGKRGRPRKQVDASSSESDGEPKKRGRPKKQKTVVPRSSGEDLIASLMANAFEASSDSGSSLDNATWAVEPAFEAKEAAESDAEKQAAKEAKKAELDAKKVAAKAEKQAAAKAESEAKKLAAKAEKLAAKEAAKAESDAKKLAVKAEKLAAGEAKKLAVKAEKLAAGEAKKKAKLVAADAEKLTGSLPMKKKILLAQAAAFDALEQQEAEKLAAESEVGAIQQETVCIPRPTLAAPTLPSLLMQSSPDNSVLESVEEESEESEEEEGVEVEEFTWQNKQYMLEPTSGTVYDRAKFMASGEPEEVGVYDSFADTMSFC